MGRDTIIKGDEFEGAEFSKCGKYRYRLWRTWDFDKPILTFILMNPSTADEIKNDPTITRQIKRATRLGFGGMVVLNCGGIRETDSRKAWKDEDPIGPHNQEVIEQAVSEGGSFIAAWGRPACKYGADEAVLRIFRARAATLQCLGVNADRSPKHPLYVGYDVAPEPYEFT